MLHKSTMLRPDLAAEFHASPYGEHSPDLQYLLNLMRRPSEKPFHVLLVERPGERWRLGIMVPGSGAAPQATDIVFDKLEAAEAYVFDLRWRELQKDAEGRSHRAEAAPIP